MFPIMVRLPLLRNHRNQCFRVAGPSNSASVTGFLQQVFSLGLKS